MSPPFSVFRAAGIFRCACGYTWAQDGANLAQEPCFVPWCEHCSISMPTVGMQIVYGAWRRWPRPYDPFGLLKRGTAYTIAQVLETSTGRWVWLEGLGDAAFPLLVFTPITYALPQKERRP